jgi:antirestriction protein ArdC
MAAGKDYREELTAKLIEQLEAGTAPWQKPWDGRSRLPYNATTDKPYRGVNSLYLSLVAGARGYEDSRWATYRQAAEQGWQVRKGEKGVGIEYWKHTESQTIHDANGDSVRGADGKAVTREVALARPRVFYATVFNLQQMEGAPEPTQRAYAWNPQDRAEQILRASGARILHDQGGSCLLLPGDR